MTNLILIIVAGGLILISAICSGLNVALMALDSSDLKRRAKLGNKDAKKALEFRTKPHLSLASILFTNVAVISATSIVLSSFLNGLVAGIISTLLIVVFGEILPQALAVKNSLRAISLFAPFLRTITVLSYPISKPLEILLNKIIGPQDERLHTRRELGLLISDHYSDDSEIDNDEVEIARNALQLSEKRVKDIMIPVNEVYHLLDDDIIDEAKIDELKHENFSRVPVFNKNKTKCDRFLLLKDLVDIDFDENPQSVVNVKSHTATSVGSMTALDTIFRKFISAKSHMMTVTKGKKIVGVVTIEDVFEEIIGQEIVDETGVEKNRQT